MLASKLSTCKLQQETCSSLGLADSKSKPLKHTYQVFGPLEHVCHLTVVVFKIRDKVIQPKDEDRGEERQGNCSKSKYHFQGTGSPSTAARFALWDDRNMANMLESYDSAFLGVLQHEGNISSFLDVVFGFLYRR